MKKADMLEVMETSSKRVTEILTEAGVFEDVIQSVNVELVKMADVVRPGKGGGAKVDPTEVANFDGNGEVTHIQCSLSKRWLPVFDEEGNENFYTDAKSDKFGGFKRLSKAAESIRQKHAKTLKATEKALLADLLNPEAELTKEDAEAKLASAQIVDYSTVGTEERPEA